MNIFSALFLGLVEGITEFLPVSSTAHLIIFSNLLGISQTNFTKLFEVVIQAGAILAVAGMYFSYAVKRRDLLIKLLFSFVPTAVLGALLYPLIKNVFFESRFLISGSLLVLGLVFLVVEILARKGRLKLVKELSQLSFGSAVLIGLGQSLAFIPGVSRVGAVMIVMMLFGYKRKEAAIYSFLLAVPTIFGASFYDLFKFQSGGMILAQSEGWMIMAGFLAALVSAVVIVHWFVGFLQRRSLSGFGIYRIILAALLLCQIIK